LFLEIICLRFSFVDHNFDKRQKGNLTGGLLIYSSNRLKVTSKIRNEKRKENENEMNGQKILRLITQMMVPHYQTISKKELGAFTFVRKCSSIDNKHFCFATDKRLNSFLTRECFALFKLESHSFLIFRRFEHNSNKFFH